MSRDRYSPELELFCETTKQRHQRDVTPAKERRYCNGGGRKRDSENKTEKPNEQWRGSGRGGGDDGSRRGNGSGSGGIRKNKKEKTVRFNDKVKILYFVKSK